ncbi:MAG: hypothetical protein OXT70_12855 [Chloroflexota bacterium]|nr:hypothetical protein [Chloroflexota bacterium]
MDRHRVRRRSRRVGRLRCRSGRGPVAGLSCSVAPGPSRFGQKDNDLYENASLGATLDPGTYIVEAATNSNLHRWQQGAYEFTS